MKAHWAPRNAAPTTHRGLALSGPVECLREMAADGVGLIDLVVAGDSMLKLDLFSRQAVLRASDRSVGRVQSSRAGPFD